MDFSRRRQRGVQPRRYDDYDGPPRSNNRGLVANNNDGRGIRMGPKVPTRVIPEYAGFIELGRNEIKRDMREVERTLKPDSGPLEEQEVDIDSERRILGQLQAPPFAPGSALMRKRSRYLAWAAQPGAMEADLKSYEKTIAYVKDENEKLKSEEEDWIYAMNVARSKLRSSITATQRYNKVMRMKADVFMKYANEEMSKSTRKRKSKN
jgi:hypothetical protein